MKYIRTQREDGMTELFVFPRTINHDHMEEVLQRLRVQGNHPLDWRREPREIVSAGFIDQNNTCYGRSETLDLESKPEDTEILARQLAL